MQFLSDVFLRCPDCKGRRYREHILEVSVQGAEGRSQGTADAGRKPEGRRKPAATPPDSSSRNTQHATRSLSIADLLESTVDEAVEFLQTFMDSRPAARAVASLKWLQEVGLGYLQLGQPINTLSGGESQRLKLARHLADSTAAAERSPQTVTANGRAALRAASAPTPQRPTRQSSADDQPPTPGTPPQPTLFILDEPTTGLHFEDVRILLQALQRLVDAGHSLLVIEHNLEVLKCADWIIDLGPEAGEAGGQLVVAGTPETVAACAGSHTGRFLKPLLKSSRRPTPGGGS
jgi:excinuclease ABC subunit A